MLEQYTVHVAYYVATRLLLIRTWEDLGLLRPMLQDGGFADQIARFDHAIDAVVSHSFAQARGAVPHVVHPLQQLRLVRAPPRGVPGRDL